MYEQVEKPKENKSRTIANSVAQKKSNVKQGFGFVDNRPALNAQRVMQQKIQCNAIIQKVRVYRGGSGTDKNLCPRPGIDDDKESAGRGLSTSSKAINGRCQVIETDKLGDKLEAVNDHDQHYAIRPTDDADNAKLEEWAASRDIGGHVRTAEVKAARVAERNKSGVETVLP